MKHKYNHDDLEREYEMLREEIRGNSAALLKITQIALPTALAIIAFAWECNKGILALSNIFLSYSMVSKQMKYRQSTFLNATYCKVFLEPYMDRKWETRLHEVEKLESCNKKKQAGWNYINRFRFIEWVAIEIISFVVFAVKCNPSNFLSTKEFLFLSSIGMILIVGHTIYHINKLTDIHSSKITYIDAWEKVKISEDNQ